MKFALPLTIPICVWLTRRFDFTMPKSASFTSPWNEIITFPADTSRWTISIGAPVLSRVWCA